MYRFGCRAGVGGCKARLSSPYVKGTTQVPAGEKPSRRAIVTFLDCTKNSTKSRRAGRAGQPPVSGDVSQPSVPGNRVHRHQGVGKRRSRSKPGRSSTFSRSTPSAPSSLHTAAAWPVPKSNADSWHTLLSGIASKGNPLETHGTDLIWAAGFAFLSCAPGSSYRRVCSQAPVKPTCPRV